MREKRGIPPTAGLVLAAGAGRRFGGPKAAVLVEGERLVDRAVRILGESGCHPIVVVLGAWIGEVDGADVVINELWDEGMSTSLHVGLAAIEETDADRVIVSLVDLVGLTSAAVRRVLACDAELVAATYGGVRGHPVMMARTHWAGAAAKAQGDRGARAYLAEHRDELVLIEVGDLADGQDLDERP